VSSPQGAQFPNGHLCRTVCAERLLCISLEVKMEILVNDSVGRTSARIAIEMFSRTVFLTLLALPAIAQPQNHVAATVRPGETFRKDIGRGLTLVLSHER
jgi:hypothetical protein